MSKKDSIEKNEKREEKIGLFDRIKGFFQGVIIEGKRVHWTSKKDLYKYSVITLVFVVFFSLFFYGINALFAFIHSLIG